MSFVEGFSKVRLGCFPTPFHELSKIGKEFGERNLYIKRDDMTGIALGGNKVRKLEFILSYAMENGYDTIITTGGAQSNHATITAACCRKLGLDCRLVLMGRGVMEEKGNLLLDSIMDIPVEFVDTDNFSGVNSRIEELMVELESEGKKPFFVPLGGSMPLGVLGYVQGMEELFNQAKEDNIFIDHIVSCVGSGGTFAGTLLGAKLINPNVKVTGIAVGDNPKFPKIVMELIEEACKMMKIENPITMEDIDIKFYFGDGYAIPSKEGNSAILKMAMEEGLYIDPVYTGKAFGGLLDLNNKEFFKEDKNIVFLHTGGAVALFAVPIE